MKNQYFGDVRDLFKYDLVLKIIRETHSINHFTFIPMLTNVDNSTDGNKIDYSKAKAGTNNNGLMEFLRKCIGENRRNIVEIKKYFKSNGIKITIYKESEYLDHKSRDNYFKRIPKEHLSNSLIFVDPDNGLEIKNSNEKHILYDEVTQLCDKMDKNSILMIYQHFPRINRKKYLNKRSNELKKYTKKLAPYISDNGIVFFFLTKKSGMITQLAKTAHRYKKHYPNLLIGNV